MDASAQIDVFKQFIEAHYYAPMLASAAAGESFLRVDFSKLSRFDPDLADELLERPTDTLRAMQLALQQFDIEVDPEKFHFRFFNLPKKDYMMIRNLRASHMGKLICMEGLVRQKSDIRPKVTSIVFECPQCAANTPPIKQNDDKVKKPTRCPKCGYKGSNFRILNQELIDAQYIVLEEITSQLEGSQQPKRLKIFLQEDLVSPLTDKKTNPGTAVRVVGILREVVKVNKEGSRMTMYDFLFEGNFIEPLAEDFTDIKISPEDEKKILDLAKDPNIVPKLVKSFAPGIYGHDVVKESIMMQFVGGVQKKRDDGVKNRGDIHLLLIGDPGSGKSQLLKRASVVAPKGRYVSGKGASGAGLTAAVVKDDILGGWTLEAGALVLANRGICMIDELDKMTTEDRSAMHEALEQQSVTIAKANIQASLMCETTVLAAANPKMGRFDPFESIAKQINLPPALINRFDLIFPFRDVPNKDQDERLANFVLGMHQISNVEVPDIDTETLRKYIIYARQHCKPKLTDEVMKELSTYYVKMRNTNVSSDGMPVISLSARQLEALIRLTEACAKLRLAKETTKRDAHRAIEVLDYCLAQIGVDPETGRVDIDRIQTGITTSQRAKVIGIREIIKDLEEKLGDKVIPMERIIDEAVQKGMTQEKAEEAISKLMLSGDLYEPKRGFVSRMA